MYCPEKVKPAACEEMLLCKQNVDSIKVNWTTIGQPLFVNGKFLL